MNRLIDGKPGLLVSKDCNRIRKSLAGGYHFKRVAIGAGQERFRDAPNKNEHSHIGDAFVHYFTYRADTADHELRELFRVGVTPYYASLMDPVNPACPIRMQALPAAREGDVRPEELRDPLGEDSHQPAPCGRA